MCVSTGSLERTLLYLSDSHAEHIQLLLKLTAGLYGKWMLMLICTLVTNGCWEKFKMCSENSNMIMAS